jgi:hypothetical protein
LADRRKNIEDCHAERDIYEIGRHEKDIEEIGRKRTTYMRLAESERNSGDWQTKKEIDEIWRQRKMTYWQRLADK